MKHMMPVSHSTLLAVLKGFLCRFRLPSQSVQSAFLDWCTILSAENRLIPDWSEILGKNPSNAQLHSLQRYSRSRLLKSTVHVGRPETAHDRSTNTNGSRGWTEAFNAHLDVSSANSKPFVSTRHSWAATLQPCQMTIYDRNLSWGKRLSHHGPKRKSCPIPRENAWIHVWWEEIWRRRVKTVSNSRGINHYKDEQRWLRGFTKSIPFINGCLRIFKRLLKSPIQHL